MKRILEMVGPPLLVLVIILALWSLTVRILDIPAFVLPGPERVFATAIMESERLMTGFRNTLIASSVGLFVATT
jgi:NitT/TauT family transport system permease protein